MIALGFGWGIFQQWRYAQRNLFERLQSFIAKEDKRLKGAREPIVSQIRRPEPKRFGYEPIYTNPSLAKALQALGWKNEKKAEHYLARSLERITERLELAKKNLSMQEEQFATVHLALGSIAASRSEHALALSEFQSVSALHSQNPEFIEHVGLQLVRVGNSQQALCSFRRNGECR